MLIKSFGYIEKINKLAEGEIEVIVNSGEWDSWGERINIDGVDIKSYMKNPVVLWSHDAFNLPIGKATKVWKESGKLMAKMKFYLKDEFPRKVYQYVIDGMINAVSIGGQVIDWAEDGVTVNKLRMKEFSIVPLPADDKALIVNKMSGLESKNIDLLAKMYARKILSEDKITENINTLKQLTAALEEIAILGEPEEGQVNIRVMLRQAQVVDHQAEKIIRSIKLKGLKNE